MNASPSPVGIGLIGLGRLGRVRAQIVARHVPGARLVAVHDIDIGLAVATAAEFGAVAVDSVEELVDHPGVDGVIVATPTAFHVVPVTAVAHAGKPLFCEKPLVSTLPDTRLLVDVIDQAGIACQVGSTVATTPTISRPAGSSSTGESVYPHICAATSATRSRRRHGPSTPLPAAVFSSTC